MNDYRWGKKKTTLDDGRRREATKLNNTVFEDNCQVAGQSPFRERERSAVIRRPTESIALALSLFCPVTHKPPPWPMLWTAISQFEPRMLGRSPGTTRRQLKCRHDRQRHRRARWLVRLINQHTLSAGEWWWRLPQR
jgi:hypothetical protein